MREFGAAPRGRRAARPQRFSQAKAPPRGNVATVDPSFGSDKCGLVWGYFFASDQPARVVDCEATAELLRERRQDGSTDWFVWLHFSLSNAAAERWLRQNLELPESFHGALREGVGSTRVEQDGDALVAVIHDVLFDFTFDASDVSTACLCVAPHLLISARPRPLRSIDRLRGAIKAGETFHSPAELLGHLFQDQANVLVEIVRKSTTRVDAIEDGLLNRRIAISRAELGGLRRMLVRLQRLLAPEPAALFRLLSRPPSWISEREVQGLRQAAEEFAAAVTDSAALVERIKLMQEELSALVSEQSNRILFLLTLVTETALPINLIAGLFGMNVGGIPLADDGHGFVTLVLVIAAFTAGVGYVAWRRKGW